MVQGAGEGESERVEGESMRVMTIVSKNGSAKAKVVRLGAHSPNNDDTVNPPSSSPHTHPPLTLPHPPLTLILPLPSPHIHPLLTLPHPRPLPHSPNNDGTVGSPLARMALMSELLRFNSGLSGSTVRQNLAFDCTCMHVWWVEDIGCVASSLTLLSHLNK